MLSAVIVLVVALIIVGLVFWVVGQLLTLVPGLPAVVHVAINILFVVIVVLVIVDFLMKLAGMGGIGLAYGAGHLRC